MTITNPVVLRTYTYRHEAEIAQGLLEANNIESSISCDDCGGLDPTINPAEAARLFVDARDARRAQRVVGV